MWLLDWVVTFDKQSDHNLYIYICMYQGSCEIHNLIPINSSSMWQVYVDQTYWPLA